MKAKIIPPLGAVLSLLITFGLIHSATAAEAGHSANQAAAGSQPGMAAAANAADEFVADELLVGFQPGTPAAQADAVRQGVGATRIKAWPQIQAEHWHLPPGLSVAQAIRALSANPNVAYAEPNYIVHAVTTVPNDPRRGELWGVNNIAQTGGTTDADIDALEAWQLPPGNGPVVVGVIDSGVDYTHEDLAGKIWTNPGEIPNNGIDDDGNGYIDDIHGWDFINNDADPMDDNGHGTHVSGTIGAIGNNGIGVIGVAGLNPNVLIMPLKFLNADGYGSDADAINAIQYAASFMDPSGNHIVRVTSNSWGRTGKPSRTMERAIQNCGALFTAAAGNNGTNDLFYPAGYTEANIISVAATDNKDSLASFSNYDPTWVDLAAPGVSILSTLPGNAYAAWSGTSMATPHVSGVAALLMSQDPAWSIDDVKAQILATVDPLPSLGGKTVTGGRLNAAKALGAPELPSDTTPPAAVTDLTPSAASQNSVTLTWTAPSDLDNAGDAGIPWLYDIRYSLNPINTDADFDTAAQAQGEPSPQATGTPETFTVENLQAESTYYFALKTIDANGNVSLLSNVASAATPVADWFYLRLWAGTDVGNYASVGVTSQGTWSVAYDADGEQMCAFYPGGGGYYNEDIMGGGIGASLAYSPDERQVSISHVSGTQLYFVTRGTNTSSAWTSTQIERKDVSPSETSLAYDASGNPVISYFKAGRHSSGLWVARGSASGWSTESVDPGAYPLYNQMAVGPSGDLAIAYSYDSDGDGSVDTLRLARFDGAAWNISTVGAGGYSGTVAYDPSGNLAVAHWDPTKGDLQFSSWTGAGWSTPEIVENAPSITGCSLDFGPDGKAYLFYGSDQMRLAIRDPGSGTWGTLTVDSSTAGGFRDSLKGRPAGIPDAVAYRGPAWTGAQSTVLLAIWQTRY